MAAILIARHGNTFAAGEIPRRIGCRSDPPLTEAGRAQMCALGLALARSGVSPSRILSSNLQRATEGADLLGEAFSPRPPITIGHDFLREIDHGPDEGALEPEVVSRLGHDALAAWARHGEAPAGWKVDADARREAWRRLLEEARRGEPSDQICVTSNGAARFALLCHPDLKVACEQMDNLSLRTGSCGMIIVGEGLTRLAFWNVRPGEGPLPPARG